MEARQVWRMVLEDLRCRLPRSDYETWLRGTAIVAFEDGLAVISTPNSFAKQWLECQAGELIRRALSSVLGYSVRMRVVVSGSGAKSSPADPSALPRKPAPAESATAQTPAADAAIVPHDRRKIGAFWVQDCILDDYAPLLGPVGLAALSFFYMMASAGTRECWFSQRHLALHLGVHRSHDLAPALDLLRKLRLVRDSGQRTASGAYIWVLPDPVPIVQALLLLLAAEDEERANLQAGEEGAPLTPRPPRSLQEKVERVRGLYPSSWRPVRRKAQFQSLEEVLAAVEKELRAATGQTPPPAG